MQGIWKTKISGYSAKRPKKIKKTTYSHIKKDKMDIILKKSRKEFKFDENVYRIENKMEKVGTRYEIGYRKSKVEQITPVYKLKIFFNGIQVDSTEAFCIRRTYYGGDMYEEINGKDVLSKYYDYDIEIKEVKIDEMKNPYYDGIENYNNEEIKKDFYIRNEKIFLYNKPYNPQEYSIYRFYKKRPFANIANKKLRRRVKRWINKGDFENSVYKNFASEKSIKYDIL